MRQASDNELFQYIIDGGRKSRQATTALYDRYARKFHSYLAFNGIVGPDADDIVQDVFLKIFRLSGSARRVENGRAYIFGMLSNAMRDFWRRQVKEPISDDFSEASCDADGLRRNETTSERHEVAADDRISLERCLERAFSAFQQQAPERANVVFLSAVEQFSPSEVAEYLGRSYGATRQYMSQCMQRFRRLVWEFCKDHVEALLEPRS